jgi:hypothetical protein
LLECYVGEERNIQNGQYWCSENAWGDFSHPESAEYADRICEVSLLSPEAWIFDELATTRERRERPAAVLELELPLEGEPAPEPAEADTAQEQGVIILDISPLAFNELKI